MRKPLRSIMSGLLAAVLVLNNAEYVSAESASVSIVEETDEGVEQSEIEAPEKEAETDLSEKEFEMDLTGDENETEEGEITTQDAERNTDSDEISSMEEDNIVAESASSTETEGTEKQEVLKEQVGETDSTTGITWALNDSELSISCNGDIPALKVYPWENHNGIDYSEKIETLVLNEGITEFDFGLTWYMENLKHIHIPKSCVSIPRPELAFLYNSFLESVDVQDGNEVFSSKDGVLFDTEKKVLYYYPSGKTDKTYIVPDSCETVNWLHSFYLETLDLGKNTVSVVSAVGGEKLKSITISDSLTDIENTIFEADELIIRESNPNFLYENHVLFKKN